ncbi:uncharacterized protein F5147DRAFT_655502 [Suillus discolor]|uniref:Fungal-type protein kinase domain-containing protein n=1 Tax=Suillus discolor TaxID=1912936 RepID=A0A9P7JR36_9AGAM|nr:uncharacterized protein F5147DRAFT_655502 [Suillus discolor]KAG2100718.1 hypothetical protein F5147DRAFT_655502 [Suillus discolor]
MFSLNPTTAWGTLLPGIVLGSAVNCIFQIKSHQTLSLLKETGTMAYHGLSLYGLIVFVLVFGVPVTLGIVTVSLILINLSRICHHDDEHVNIWHFAISNVLWEETDLPAITPSIMDHLIPISSLSILDIEKITYTSRVPIFAGRKWELNKNAKKQTLKQKQAQDTSSDLEEWEDGEGSFVSVVPDTSNQTSGCQEYNPRKPDGKPSLKWSEEQKWVMCMAYKKVYPLHSPVFPFESQEYKHPHRQWSPEFRNTPIPDATNTQKPNVVLLDCNVQPKSWAHVLTCVEITESDLGAHRDILLFKGMTTKGYLMMQEQPWHCFVIIFSLAANNLHTHYTDRLGLIITRPISIVGNLMQCDVGDKAIGWIEDKKKERLLIISILWRSQGLFSCGTICYRVQDRHGCDYALKDCWVDKAKKDHEERVLEIVWGIPNVVTLMDAWDVEYEGQPDSTLWIHNLHGTFSLGFCSHKAMMKRNILHGDLSPNNFIIFDGCGYYIDFDQAQIITESNTSVRSWGTGTVPYMSIRLLYAATAIDRANGRGSAMIEHTASDDLESLFYILINFITTFDGPMAVEDMGAAAAAYKSGLVLVPWCKKELMNLTTTYFGGLKDLTRSDADLKCSGITHEEIEEVLNAWISHEGADESLPLEKLRPTSPLLSELALL